MIKRFFVILIICIRYVSYGNALDNVSCTVYTKNPVKVKANFTFQRPIIAVAISINCSLVTSSNSCMIAVIWVALPDVADTQVDRLLQAELSVK